MTERTHLIPRFFIFKNTENTKFREQHFSKNNTKIVFFAFLKTVLKNNFHKQDPNITCNGA